ncbi:MAG: helix-turn-helix transcriptional regulator [Clostridium sp.]|nr:helix-turn-helix transcriptional regulator [Clostridium sp.]
MDKRIGRGERMPFKKIEVEDIIAAKRIDSLEFGQTWDISRNEYELLHEIIRIRKGLGLTQRQLADAIHSTQQEISRLEKREHSPALRTICRIVNCMGYELVLQKKNKS